MIRRVDVNVQPYQEVELPGELLSVAVATDLLRSEAEAFAAGRFVRLEDRLWLWCRSSSRAHAVGLYVANTDNALDHQLELALDAGGWQARYCGTHRLRSGRDAHVFIGPRTGEPVYL